MIACENPTAAGSSITYDIGDIGPGGGIIFYRNDYGFIMTDDSQICHYLEAAPEDMTPERRWSTKTEESFPDAARTGMGIGTGRKNTARIILADPYTLYEHAALACYKYSGNGHDDWFLPGRDELHELYENRDEVGIPCGGYYWSSSQFSHSAAWIVNFSNGAHSCELKNDTFRVRAIRAF